MTGVRQKVTVAQIEAVDALIRGCAGLSRAIRYLPAQARDFYTDDGASPVLALQLYSESI